MGLRGCKPKPRPLCRHCGQPVKRSRDRYCSQVCQQCGASFKPKAKGRVTFCSRGCAFAYKQANAKEKPLRLPRPCTICGIPLPSNRWCFCSHACTQESARRYQRKRWEEQKYGPVGKKVTNVCRECGEDFSPPYGKRFRTFCSDECGERYSRRVGKAARRARLRRVRVESVDPRQIWERDGWRCGVCGGKIPRTAKVPHPKAATIDHIIPLARGGNHESLNLQAAHFICNATKNHRGCGQLRLMK